MEPLSRNGAAPTARHDLYRHGTHHEWVHGGVHGNWTELMLPLLTDLSRRSVTGAESSTWVLARHRVVEWQLLTSVDVCHLPRYTLHLSMAIIRFRHKVLGRFFSEGSAAGIQGKHATRLRLILGRLSVAVEPRDMGLPGLALHPLKGARHGTWAVSVSGNWRVTFRFDGPDATDVDHEDYH